MKEVALSGTATLIGEEVLFQGRFSGVSVGECDRCLEEARVPVEGEVCWFFTSGPAIVEGAAAREQSEVLEVDPDDPEPPGRIAGGEVDMAPMLWEELVLAAPSKCVCREDCRGLCPVCGANLNLAPCGCGPLEAKDTGTGRNFAQLKDLLPDYKHEPSED